MYKIDTNGLMPFLYMQEKRKCTDNINTHYNDLINKCICYQYGYHDSSKER